MGKHTKLISLLLALTMLLSMIISCAQHTDDTQDKTSSEATDDTPSESGEDEPNSESKKPSNAEDTEDASNADASTSAGETEGESVTPTESTSPNPEDKTNFLLFSDKKYTVNVVIPDMSTPAEDVVYAKLRAVLKSLTNVSVTYCSDFLAVGKTRDPNEKAILVGNTNYEDSKKIMDDSVYGQYSLSVTDNKIVFSFTSKNEGIELVDIFEKSLKSNESGEIWVPRSLSISKQAFLQLRDVPKYPSYNITLVDCEDNTSMVVAEKTNSTDFNSYCESLEANDYELTASRDVNNNLYRTYTKGSLALTVYFTSYAKTARIVAGPIDDIPSQEIDTTPETHTPTLTILSQTSRLNNGLGLIYLMPNGKFLIIDGGYTLNSNIYKTLERLAPNKKEIVVAAWFLSHPHGDHQQSLMSVLRERHSNLKIENIFFNYTTAEQYDAVTTGADGAKSASTLRSTLNKYIGEDTKIIKPHTGQIYKYGSTEVEILYTVEDVLPKTLDYLNTSSLVVRVKMGEHSLLALADTTHLSGDIMRNTYGAHLESEMVQLAHHGTYPGNASLYNTIKGKVLIWPSNLTNVKAQINNTAVVAALNQASDVYLANTATVTLTLPYTILNNKEDFMSSINPTPSTEETNSATEGATKNENKDETEDENEEE